MARRTLPIDVRNRVLHEAGYKCSVPSCRCILTFDMHHLDPVKDGGSDDPENLLALCPTCHRLYHKGEIPIESLRAWKMLQLAMNEAFDRRAIDLLLTFDKINHVFVSGEGVLQCASLIAAGLVERREYQTGSPIPDYSVNLTKRGRAMVKAWKQGDQKGATEAIDD